MLTIWIRRFWISRISWNNPMGKRNKKSAKLTIGWRSPKGNCKLSSKPGNPHFVVLLIAKSVLPEWRKMMSWPRLFNCRARLPTMYATPPMISSPEVTSRILTVIHKFGELMRILIHRKERKVHRDRSVFLDLKLWLFRVFCEEVFTTEAPSS